LSDTLTSAVEGVSPGSRLVPESEYQPFPCEGGRDWRQQYLEIPLMLWALGIPRYRRVLEIGCGRGNALPVLARRLWPSRLAGVDIAFSFLSEARERVVQEGVMADLVWADARDLPFPDQSFDIVIDFGTCFHISQAAEAVAQVGRVLVPGGLFVTETRLNQRLSHPVRSRGRTIPWDTASRFVRERDGWLWESRRRM